MAPLRILTGQTASGKASAAVCLAKEVGAELISLDSMKIYRGLDIGTAKPPRAVRDVVQFHMVDIVDPHENYTLARYLSEAQAAAVAIEARGNVPVFVGGTPLYLRGLVYGIFEGPPADWALRDELKRRAELEGPEALHKELRAADPATADRLHPNDLLRIIRALEVVRLTGRPISAHQTQYPAKTPAVEYRMAALRRSDHDLRQRINRRVDRMFEAGLVEEARRLLEQGDLNRSAARAIGYKETLAHVRGEASYAETVESVKRNTWRLARKQRTWLKSFPGLQWIDVAPEDSAEAAAERVREALFGAADLN